MRIRSLDEIPTPQSTFQAVPMQQSNILYKFTQTAVKLSCNRVHSVRMDSAVLLACILPCLRYRIVVDDVDTAYRAIASNSQLKFGELQYSRSHARRSSLHSLTASPVCTTRLDTCLSVFIMPHPFQSTNTTRPPSSTQEKSTTLRYCSSTITFSSVADHTTALPITPTPSRPRKPTTQPSPHYSPASPTKMPPYDPTGKRHKTRHHCPIKSCNMAKSGTPGVCKKHQVVCQKCKKWVHLKTERCSNCANK